MSDTHAGWSFLFEPDNDVGLAELERRRESSRALNWLDVAASGGFPRPLAAPPDRRLRLLANYVEVLRRRDIREVVGIDSVERFDGFFRVIAAHRAGTQVLVVISGTPRARYYGPTLG